MSRALSIALFALVLAQLPLSGQASQAVLRLQALEAPSLEQAELAAIQNLVLSAIVELKTFRVLDTAGQEEALAEAEAALALGKTTRVDPLSADYLIGGSILPAGELLIFSLEATRVSTGEKRSVSEALSDRGELVLAARRLTRRLLEGEAPPEPGRAELGLSAAASAPGPGEAPGPGAQASGPGAAAVGPGAPSLALPEADRRPSLAKLAGSWSGDKGIDRVKLYADGRGIAFLSSGASMRIKASLLGDRIVISQDQPNRPEFYRSGAIDLATARTISTQARPWKWTFAISVDGKSLFGIKESVFVSRDDRGRLSVDNDYVRNALWLRTGR